MRRLLYICMGLCCLAMLSGTGWAIVGDTCTNPIVIDQLPYFYQVNCTGIYNNTIDLGEGNACTEHSTAGDDVFFKLVMPDTLPPCWALEIVMPCGGDINVAAYVLSTCDADSCIEGSDQHGPGEFEYLEVILEGGEDYYFVIDGREWDDTGCVMISISECEVDVEENSDLAGMGTILNICPNPAVSEAMISYSVSAPSYVTLDVLTASGRTVKSLYNGHAEPGLHSLSWNGNSNWGADLPGGTYFVILSTKDERVMRKVQFMR